jgi:hypothetical protein
MNDTIECNGRTFRVEIEHDDSGQLPWENDCIFDGVVSDWESRGKRPYEKILNQDRRLKRFFNVKRFIEVAKSHGCSGKEAHEQLERSFEYLRSWCNDQWSYVGVIVTLLDDDGAPNEDYVQSLWGIESDAYDYLNQVAQELAQECFRDYETHTAKTTYAGSTVGSK